MVEGVIFPAMVEKGALTVSLQHDTVLPAVSSWRSSAPGQAWAWMHLTDVMRRALGVGLRLGQPQVLNEVVDGPDEH